MMFQAPFNLMTYMTMFTSTLMALSSNNWLMLWMSLELNLLAFIPIMVQFNQFQETEASVKYFLVQALGSSLLIMSSSMMWLSSNLMSMFSVFLIMSMIIKIGMAPCHMWYPSVMTSINWLPALVLSTWQKLAPLSIMAFYLTKLHPTLMMTFAGLNALTGGLLGMNQSHLRSIMAYSSITHLGWMTALMWFLKPMATMMYFMIYVIIIAPIFISMFMMNMNTMNNMSSSNSYLSMFNIILPIMLLSLAGLPPLTGFFPKWMSMYIMSEKFLILITLIMGSLMNLYFYLNITLSAILSKLPMKSHNMKPSNHSYNYILTFSTASMFMLPLLMI